MSSATDSWGIEVGSNAIKGVHLHKSGKDIQILAADAIPFKKVLTTPDIDTEEAIRVALDQFAARHDIGKSNVVVSVPGHSAFARFAKLPPVEPKAVAGIVQYEAQQQIPFPINEVEWDYQTFQHVDSPDVEVGIFAITKQRVLQWLANYQTVGIEPNALTLSPLAAYNAIAFDQNLDDDSPGTILMDIGTSATDLIIIEGGRLWLRTIPIGGHQFTEALARGFKLSYTKAEKIKREAESSKYARQIFQTMRPVFVDLVGEVQKSLGYYQSLNRDADLTHLIGIGSTFNLPGLQKFLKQQLDVEVKRMDSFTRLNPTGTSAEIMKEHGLSMAPAVGLALQGLEEETVDCNIMPTSILRKQLWATKHPWNIAAALIFVAAAVLAFGRYNLDSSSYYANTDTNDRIDGIIASGGNFVQGWKDIENGADPRKKIENLRRLPDYREVWPLILTDIQGALASLKSQQPILDGDYVKIKEEIPIRADRRQVNIETIEYSYHLKNESADSIDIWGPLSQITEYVEEEEGGSSYSEEEQYDEFGEIIYNEYEEESDSEEDEFNSSKPYYLITMTGTTPFADAATFLESTIVTWLQEKEEQMALADKASQARDRPYRILDVAMKDISLVAALNAENNAGSIIRENVPTRAPSRTGRPRGVHLPGITNLPTAEDEAAQAEAQQAEAIATIEDLLPKNPLADEPTNRDWKFIINWRVELIRPEYARQARTAKKIQTPPAESTTPNDGAPEDAAPATSMNIAPASANSKAVAQTEIPR